MLSYSNYCMHPHFSELYCPLFTELSVMHYGYWSLISILVFLLPRSLLSLEPTGPRKEELQIRWVQGHGPGCSIVWQGHCLKSADLAILLSLCLIAEWTFWGLENHFFFMSCSQPVGRLGQRGVTRPTADLSLQQGFLFSLPGSPLLGHWNVCNSY